MKRIKDLWGDLVPMVRGGIEEDMLHLEKKHRPSPSTARIQFRLGLGLEEMIFDFLWIFFFYFFSSYIPLRFRFFIVEERSVY